MTTLGVLLQQTREEKGISLLEVSEKTKISRRFLEALESERFDLLPAEAFVRGFLRAYAQAIGLDAEEVLSHYREVTAPPEEPEVHPAPAFQRSSPRAYVRHGPSLAVSMSIGVAAVLVVLLAAWQLVKQRQSTTIVENRAAMVAEQAPGETPAPPAPVLSVPLQRDLLVFSIRDRLLQRDVMTRSRLGGAVETRKAPPPSAVASGNGRPTLTLIVRAQTASWLQLSIDRGPAQHITLSNGDERHWQAVGEFLVTLGNIEAAQLFLNGQRLLLPQTRDRVLRDYTIDAHSLGGAKPG